MMVGSNVKFYGNVVVPERAIIEDNVIIGHPSAEDVRKSIERTSQYQSLDCYYNAVASGVTMIGANAVIRSGTVIYTSVEIGDDFECGHFVLIREGCRLGRSVYLKAHTHLMRNVTLGDGCRVSAVIADNSHIGDGSSIFGTLTHRRPKRKPSDAGPWIGPTIGRNALIGRGAVVLGPVSVGNDATVGANVLVRKDIADGVTVIE